MKKLLAVSLVVFGVFVLSMNMAQAVVDLTGSFEITVEDAPSSGYPIYNSSGDKWYGRFYDNVAPSYTIVYP